jgi:hypothetical protein
VTIRDLLDYSGIAVERVEIDSDDRGLRLGCYFNCAQRIIRRGN